MALSSAAQPPPSNGVGVDGCRAGWFAVWQAGTGTAYRQYATIAEVWQGHPSADTILVDIPMGLTNSQPRLLEPAMRRLLGRKSSSVFPVPCRDAVYAPDFATACTENLARFGKKVSIQAFNICAKIQEMDQLLRSDPQARNVFGESHPELVFSMLGGSLVVSSKKQSAGIEARLTILESYRPELRSVYRSALSSYPRSHVARDDIVDAMALFVAAVSVRQLDVKTEIGEGGVPIRLFIPSRESLLFSPDFIC